MRYFHDMHEMMWCLIRGNFTFTFVTGSFYSAGLMKLYSDVQVLYTRTRNALQLRGLPGRQAERTKPFQP
jgi:hypothetical protein